MICKKSRLVTLRKQIVLELFHPRQDCTGKRGASSGFSNNDMAGRKAAPLAIGLFMHMPIHELWMIYLAAPVCLFWRGIPYYAFCKLKYLFYN